MSVKRRSSAAKAIKGKRGRPRKTTVATIASSRVSRKTASIQPSKKAFVSSRWTESYTSLLMGVVVVIVAVLFVVSFLKQTHHIQDTSSIATAITPNSATAQPSELSGAGQTGNKRTYTVESGDDLWHIAEKFYKSGYNWVDVAKANNLTNPGIIHAGNILIIPSVTPEVATITAAPSQAQPSVAINNAGLHAITGTTYTVQTGDNLWNIAVRAYADGYRWVDIAKANNLDNPGLIFSGNVLKIPR